MRPHVVKELAEHRQLKDWAGSQGGSIVNSSCLFAVCGVGDESCTVKVKGGGVPAVPDPGVPEISPVAGFRLRPSGRFGVTNQLKGWIPPELCKVVPVGLLIL